MDKFLYGLVTGAVFSVPVLKASMWLLHTLQDAFPS